MTETGKARTAVPIQNQETQIQRAGNKDRCPRACSRNEPERSHPASITSRPFGAAVHASLVGTHCRRVCIELTAAQKASRQVFERDERGGSGDDEGGVP